MKATFALLTDTATSNVLTRWAWRLHREYGLGVGVRRLPPHVSLKQPFEVGDLDALESYFDAFAGGVVPFSLELGGWQLWEVPIGAPASGVLSLAVAEMPRLRTLHERLNGELSARFGECPAAFDGAGYQFHVTVAAGEAPVESYRRALATCRREPVPGTVAIGEMALFVYAQNEVGDWDYTTYKVLPLTGSNDGGGAVSV